MDKLRSDSVSLIRGCLLSVKGKVPIRQLIKDYNTICGEDIPYAKLGYKRLEDFIQSDPTFILTRGNAGEVFVHAKTNEKSTHITQMVTQQKNSKKPPPKIQRHSKSVRFDFPSDQRPNITSKWRPKDVNNKWRKVSPSTRPAAVSHNQIVNNRLNTATNRNKSKQPVQNRPKTDEERGGVKQRINKKMAGLNVRENGGPSVERDKERSTERDSGNCSPISDSSLAPSSEFVRSHDPLADLRGFVEFHKLGEIDVSTMWMKTLYSCKIKVDNHTYTSYPNEFLTAVDAEKYCAEQALNELIPRYQRRKSLLISSERDVLERIPPMLEKHHHGIWAWQLKLDYADAYNEQLPADFLKIIDCSNRVQVERCSNDYILRHCRPGDALQKGHLSSKLQITIPNVSVPSNTVQFGDDGKLYARATCIVSTNEIWCQQLNTDESDSFNLMMARLEVHYQSHQASLTVRTVNQAGYYVAKLEDSYYRVRAVAETEDGVHCFFIDFGDEIVVPKTDIFQLKREFAKEQAQAFVCRLVGLEDLNEFSYNSEVLQTLMKTHVVLEMASDVLSDENANDLCLPVYMYDMESGDSINEKLIPLLSMESATPELTKGAINEVYVSNVESNGDIYVQLVSRGLTSLKELLMSVEAQVIENPSKNVAKFLNAAKTKGKLFFAKRKPDGRWNRVQFIDWSPCGNFSQIYYVDHGSTDVINVSNEHIYPLESLNDILNQFPFQALKVRMAIEGVPENFSELARKELPESVPVLLKVVSDDSEGVPTAEFFRRNADGSLLCVNKSIAMETELNKRNNADVKGRKIFNHAERSKNVPSSGKLPAPVLPKIGDYFEVYVPFAVNPNNFFVQPLESQPMLHRLMEEIQEKYKGVQYSPLQIDQVVPGNIYASRHEDGYWYRTSVIKVIHSGSISVFYCDFGYYANLTVQQLLPLDVQFTRLPYQALKAKLAGIKPKQSKWTMEDCDTFKKLVERKRFYPSLIDIEKDVLYESDLVLKIVLIDTSKDDDVIIGGELIKKGIAIQD